MDFSLWKDRCQGLQEVMIEGGRTIVLSVHPRSPVASADLRVGDQVLEVNTENVAESAATDIMALVHRLARARVQPLQLDIVRSGDRHRVHPVAVPACQFSLLVIEEDQVNDLEGKRIGGEPIAPIIGAG